ncbi:MAG: single-stranded-DNA-specific exonuclease RecJ [Desulfuromonadales bacterium]|nr:single-stranded-DNA-specific exonuclease RecJ [Desulfuromonadales bacterium]
MDPVTERQWRRRAETPDEGRVAELAARLGLERLTARLLLGRGLDGGHAETFLRARLADLPDPFRLPDMQRAVDRLAAAIAAGEPVAVHGDYDVDGISGTALLVAGLRLLGAEGVSWHIPLRLRDGYGLSAAALHDAAAARVAVVVTVDCGVSAHAEAVLAGQLGLDLIVTDHHQPPTELPPAFALVNPHCATGLDEFTDLAGVGVAFFLLIALRKQLRDHGRFAAGAEPDLRQLLDLVALGTIADLVPLRGVNRALCKAGLALLNSDHRPGIAALKQVAGVDSVTTGTVGFQLAPRLNAAGRLEDAGRGVDLLLEPEFASALPSAQHLDQCNRERRDLEEQTFRAAEAALAALPRQQRHGIVLAGEGWHPGVIGIVASRLVERYHRPTVLIALDGDTGKGSARSIRGFHLYQGLEACADCLDGFGGHAMAAGLTVAAARVDAFAEAFDRLARARLNDDDLIPSLYHDGSLLLEEVDLAVLQELASLAPFGIGNPEPVLLVEGARAMQVQTLKDQHLKFTVCQGGYGHPAIAFGMAERRSELQGAIDLLVSPQINSYRGRETVQLRVKDVRPALTD